jgi:hypothetical protein
MYYKPPDARMILERPLGIYGPRESSSQVFLISWKTILAENHVVRRGCQLEYQDSISSRIPMIFMKEGISMGNDHNESGDRVTKGSGGGESTGGETIRWGQSWGIRTEGYWDEDVLTLLFFVAADVVLRKGF